MSTEARGIVVVDASVLVRVLIPQDVHHERSRQWLTFFNVTGGTVLAPVLLFPEIAGAISRRTSSPSLGLEAVARLQRLSSVRIVTIDERLGQAATRVAAELRLRGADATYVALAEQLSVPLFTWDEEQTERAKSLIDVRQPE